MKMPIYLDYNATTPVDERVVAAMLPCFAEHFGNPSSKTHAWGWAAAKLVETARQQVAAGLGAEPEEILFTAGATEANNFVIKGLAAALASRGRRIVTCATEHPAVLEPCRRLARAGFEVVELPVDSSGRIDPQQVEDALVGGTILVSVMLANNEIGTLQPLVEVAAICRERNVLLHTDATQAVGKIPVDVGALGVDFLSLSAHKLYGPKGVGALYSRRRKPRLALEPLLDGGSQEQGARSGTLNVPGIVGLGRALELRQNEMASDMARLTRLRARLEERLFGELEGVLLNGHPTERLPNTSSLAFPGVDGAALFVGLKEIAVSSGSACSTADPKPSHVLLALGRSREQASASLRFSLGRGTTPEDIEIAASAVIREVKRLRRR
jgi:cysteine desulfurase